MQRNYAFQEKGSEAMILSGMDKLNSLRGTIDDNLIGENQLTFEMTSEPEGRILGYD